MPATDRLSGFFLTSGTGTRYCIDMTLFRCPRSDQANHRADRYHCFVGTQATGDRHNVRHRSTRHKVDIGPDFPQVSLDAGLGFLGVSVGTAWGVLDEIGF